jgi:hypothetical protein
MSLCLGSFLAIPTLVSQQQEQWALWQEQQRQRQIFLGQHSQPQA